MSHYNFMQIRKESKQIDFKAGRHQNVLVIKDDLSHFFALILCILMWLLKPCLTTWNDVQLLITMSVIKKVTSRLLNWTVACRLIIDLWLPLFQEQGILKKIKKREFASSKIPSFLVRIFLEIGKVYCLLFKVLWTVQESIVWVAILLFNVLACLPTLSQ